MKSNYRVREHQHLASGPMTTASVWGEREYIDLGVTCEDHGAKYSLTARLTPGEARKLAAHLNICADALANPHARKEQP